MCTYCGCESIEVVGRFTREHVDVINAAGLLRRAIEGDAPQPEVVELVEALTALLVPHTHAEEAGLFAVMREDEIFAEHVDRLCAEHTALDAGLAAVRAGDRAALDGFYSDLREHIHREENGLFPAAASNLTGEDWDRVDALTPAAGQ